VRTVAVLPLPQRESVLNPPRRLRGDPLNATAAPSLSRGCPLVKRRSVALEIALDARLLRSAVLPGLQAAL
jgi:hypothetical protein